MLHTFNPNLQVKSRKKMSKVSWKTLASKKPSDYIEVLKSDYDSFKTPGSKGATIAAYSKGSDGNEVFLRTTCIAEAIWPKLMGNFSPADMSGNFVVENCMHSGARRSIELRLGSLSDRTRQYLKSQGRSDEGIERLIADQIKFKEMVERDNEYIASEAARLVTGPTRKATEEWMKNNKVSEGVLHVLFNNTTKKDKIDNVVYGVKHKGIKKKDKEDYFKLSAKSLVLNNKKYPVYPIVMDHRSETTANGELEPVSMLPDQETIDRIYCRTTDDSGKVNVTYHGFDEDTNTSLDDPMIRQGDLVKMVYRPKFFKDSSGIGFTNELREVHLFARAPYQSNKRKAESDINPNDAKKEFDSYF